jgi:hypothetical protein
MNSHAQETEALEDALRSLRLMLEDRGLLKTPGAYVRMARRHDAIVADFESTVPVRVLRTIEVSK